MKKALLLIIALLLTVAPLSAGERIDPEDIYPDCPEYNCPDCICSPIPDCICTCPEIPDNSCPDVTCPEIPPCEEVNNNFWLGFTAGYKACLMINYIHLK